MMYALLFAALSTSTTADDKAPCPLVLPRTMLEVNAPTGWTGYTPSIMRLTGYGMMAGPPQSMTYLVPSGSKRLKDGKVTNWQFASGEERWMYCTYDDSSAVQISKRLPDDATECALAHKLNKFGSIGEMTVSCR